MYAILIQIEEVRLCVRFRNYCKYSDKETTRNLLIFESNNINTSRYVLSFLHNIIILEKYPVENYYFKILMGLALIPVLIRSKRKFSPVT